MENDESKIVSLADARDRRDGPDAAHWMVDARGVKWFEFCCEFDDAGSTFCFNIWATDFKDAERRLGLIKENARVEGQIYATVPE